PVPVAALPAFDPCEGLALVRRCCSASDGKHLVAAIAVMTRKQGRNPVGILLRRRRGRENPKPNRQAPAVWLTFRRHWLLASMHRSMWRFMPHRLTRLKQNPLPHKSCRINRLAPHHATVDFI